MRDDGTLHPKWPLDPLYRATLLRQLTEAGHAISTIARLEAPRLSDLLHGQRSALQLSVAPGEFATVVALQDASGIRQRVVREQPDDFNALKASLAFVNLDPSCQGASLRPAGRTADLFKDAPEASVQRRSINPVKLSVQLVCANANVGGTLAVAGFVGTANVTVTSQFVLDSGESDMTRDAGITPIVCVGETLADREAGRTEFVVKRQLSAVIHAVGHCASEIVVAYEPVWAIGTGRTATPEQAQAVHAVLRSQLKAASAHSSRNRILYGGSMNAGNAAELLSQPDIDGGLIGGASLKADEFLSIIASCPLAAAVI